MIHHESMWRKLYSRNYSTPLLPDKSWRENTLHVEKTMNNFYRGKCQTGRTVNFSRMIDRHTLVRSTREMLLFDSDNDQEQVLVSLDGFERTRKYSSPKHRFFGDECAELSLGGELTIHSNLLQKYEPSKRTVKTECSNASDWTWTSNSVWFKSNSKV
jgi:hypothetical protein